MLLKRGWKRIPWLDLGSEIQDLSWIGVADVKFTNHKTFDRFLRRAGAPCISFTLAVKEIHLQDVLHLRFRCRKKNGTLRRLHQISVTSSH